MIVRPWFAAAAVLALATAAQADSKTITVENCAKVEIEIIRVAALNGERYLQTVRCVGDDANQPKVKEPTSGTITIKPMCGGISCFQNAPILPGTVCEMYGNCAN
jgi:hypothetical protein